MNQNPLICKKKKKGIKVYHYRKPTNREREQDKAREKQNTTKQVTKQQQIHIDNYFEGTQHSNQKG